MKNASTSTKNNYLEIKFNLWGLGWGFNLFIQVLFANIIPLVPGWMWQSFLLQCIFHLWGWRRQYSFKPNEEGMPYCFCFLPFYTFLNPNKCYRWCVKWHNNTTINTFVNLFHLTYSNLYVLSTCLSHNLIHFG